MAAFRESVPNPGSARQLIRLFAEAGLPFPNLFREVPVGGGDHSLFSAWLTETLRIVWPRLLAMGVATEQGFPGNLIVERVRGAALRAQSQLDCPAQVCAWVVLEGLHGNSPGKVSSGRAIVE